MRLDAFEVMIILASIALLGFGVLAMGSHDSRYDNCEKQYPKTSDYRACVKRFQDDDAALAASSAAMSAATIVSIQ